MGRHGDQLLKELSGHYTVQEGGKRLYIPADLAASLDKEQDPLPFRGMRAHSKHEGSWLLSYKRQYAGTAAKTAWNQAFLTLSKAQQSCKEDNQNGNGTSSTCSGQLRGHHLRDPRLTYFAVGAVVQEGLQGDLACAAEAEAAHQVMFTAEPGFWLASLQGKYWPWKLALAESWAECQKKPGVQEVPEAEHSRTTKFWRVLHKAVQLMDGRPYHQWHNHCGRGVAFHSGFLKLVQDLGLVAINPPEGAQPRDWAPVNLSCTAGRQHHLRAASTSSTSCPPDLQLQLDKYLAAADLLSSTLSSPPRTCQEYISKFIVFQKEVTSLRAPHVGGGYTVPWTFRSAAVARMRANSIKALAKPEAVSPADFAAAFPDQNNWISQLQGSSTCQTLADFLKLLSYQGPPELLTMKLCLHLEADLQLYNPAWLWRHADKLHSGAQELATQLGFFPHIAVYLQLLREQWSSEQAKWPKLSFKLTAAPAVPAVPAVPKNRIKGKGNGPPSSAPLKKARTATASEGLREQTQEGATPAASCGADLANQSTDDDVIAVPCSPILPVKSVSILDLTSSVGTPPTTEAAEAGALKVTSINQALQKPRKAPPIPSSWHNRAPVLPPPAPGGLR